MKKLPVLSALLAGFYLPAITYADNPWLLEKGVSVISITYVSESFDEIWKGDKNGDIPEINQQTLWMYFGTAINKNMMVDILTGYTSTSWDADPPLGDIEGITDTRLRVRWNLRDEFSEDSGPSLSVAAAGILRGTYERSQTTDVDGDSIREPNVHAPGDKAHGFEITAQIGQSINDMICVSAEVGYRWRFNDTPDDTLANVGAYLSLSDALSARVIYSIVQSVSGPDIGESGVTPDTFHETKEEIESIEFAIDYDFLTGHSLSLGAAQVLDGRNTGRSTIYHAGYSYTF